MPAIVRITRSVTLELANEEFVQAARARGDGGRYILFAEILPNAWPPIIVEASLRITFAILLGAALSFLGMGAQPPSSDWGLMISEARAFVDTAPWIALAPGLAMCVTVVGDQPARRRAARGARSPDASARSGDGHDPSRRCSRSRDLTVVYQSEPRPAAGADGRVVRGRRRGERWRSSASRAPARARRR